MLIFILVVVFLIISIANTIFGSLSSLNRAKPLVLWKAYLVFFLGGIAGMHSFYLKRYYSGFIAFICSVTLIIANFSLLKAYWYSHSDLLATPVYSTFSQYVFYILIAVLITDFIGMPYYVYKYNNIHYRRNSETNDILNGKSLEVDIFYEELSIQVKLLDELLEDTNEILADDSWIIEDEAKDTSFWGSVKAFGKDLVTGGKASKLEAKLDRLRCLSAYCSNLKNKLDVIDDYNFRLEEYLETARISAFRNLYLAKELIFLGKSKIKDKKQVVVVDKSFEVDQVTDIMIDTVEDINFNSNKFFSTMGTSVNKSLNNLGKSIEINNRITKEDLTVAAIDVGIDAIVSSISQVFTMNTELKRNLIIVEENIEKATEYIGESIEAIMMYKASLLRQSEILMALVACNKAFISSYEPLREIVFGKPNLIGYLFNSKVRKKYIQSTKFKEDIQHLIMLCSDYNKVNQSKVIE